MNSQTKSLLGIVFICTIFLFATTVKAQEVFANSTYELDLNGATEAPKLGGFPQIRFPKEAIKNGVEGTLIAEMMLNGTGKLSDIVIIQPLPFGYVEAFKEGFNTFSFTPAQNLGLPVAVKLHVELTVTMVYEAGAKNVGKPKILEQPDAVYPESERADDRKGEVTVTVLFNKDGTLKILAVGSTMPKPFDQSAVEAAKLIKFTPGTHKKSKQPISVKMNVSYKFKP